MARSAALQLALAGAIALGGCGFLADRAGLVTAEDVAGVHTGALEGVSIASREDLQSREKRLVVDVDVLHEVVIEQTGDFEVAISSAVLPRIRALILGAGSVALDLKVLEIEASPGDGRLQSVGVDQLLFVKHEGEWVLVLQMSKLGLAPEEGSSVNAYQFVSYPEAVAGRLSRDEAIRYVDAVLDLAGQAQRL